MRAGDPLSTIDRAPYLSRSGHTQTSSQMSPDDLSIWEHLGLWDWLGPVTGLLMVAFFDD